LLRLENGDTNRAFLTDFGRHLFEALFTFEVASLYRGSLGQVRGQGKGLRVRLHLEPPELAALPWEFMYDAQEDCFLAISPETALVRYVPVRGAARATAVTPPLRVLVVISNPGDAQPLDVAHEKGIIQGALRPRVDQGLVQLRFLERGRVADISQAMRDFRPHVFHFIGHGQFEDEAACVLLEDEDGCALAMDELAFREFFLGVPDTRLAVLNACQTASVSSTRPLAGLAPRLLQRYLSAVVAMQYPMADNTALIFSREFYRCLALGYPLDAAAAEARKGIFLEAGADTPDWGIPVLFLRAEDGRLFEMAGGAASASAGVDPGSGEAAGGGSRYQVGDIQAGIVNVGGAQTFSGNLSLNLDFSRTTPQLGVSGMDDRGGAESDFEEARLDVQSRLADAARRIGALANIGGEAKDALVQLTVQLSRHLQQIPAERAGAAVKVCRRAEALIEELAQAEPDADMVAIRGESLSRAAGDLADAAPDVLAVATRMAAQANRIVTTQRLPMDDSPEVLNEVS